MENEDWNFVIPLTIHDLLLEVDGQYSVNKISDTTKYWNKIKDVRAEFRTQGCISILQHFDLLYSLLDNKEIEFFQLHEFHDVLVTSILTDLTPFIKESLEANSLNEKHKAVNIIKMNFFIIFFFIKTYEDKISFNSENFMSEPKKLKGAKSKSKQFEDKWDWFDKKKYMFSKIHEVLHEDLNKLWSSQVMEESLVNLIGNCCYKAFENGDNKIKQFQEPISHVLAILAASYNYGLTLIPKVVQLMKQNEHVAQVFAQTAIILSQEHKCSSVISKILKELLCAIKEEDLPGLGKSAATFISEIPGPILLNSVEDLYRFLVVEPYSVRNSTLAAFGDIILHCFSEVNINDEDKEIRNQLLKHLHNHLRDQNSYVRSKVLQIWCNLAKNRAIPKQYFMHLLQTAKNRINDKSLMAVKNAIQLFTAVLQENPYAAKLNLSDMRGQLLLARTQLKSIHAKRVLSREEQWSCLEVELILEINRQVSNLENGNIENKQSAENVSLQEVILIIIKLLEEKHFLEALDLLLESELEYPDALEIRCNLDKKSDPVEYYTAVFKKLFTQTPDVCEQEIVAPDTNINEEYCKQKIIVDYIEVLQLS